MLKARNVLHQAVWVSVCFFWRSHSEKVGKAHESIIDLTESINSLIISCVRVKMNCLAILIGFIDLIDDVLTAIVSG